MGATALHISVSKQYNPHLLEPFLEKVSLVCFFRIKACSIKEECFSLQIRAIVNWVQCRPKSNTRVLVIRLGGREKMSKF